jgi:hypothetical protein
MFLLKYLLMPLLSFSCRSASSSRFRFAERNCQHDAMYRAARDASLILLTCFAMLWKPSVTIAIIVCLLFILPIFATVVCVSLAIVIDYEVVLV